jgi:hypothetical protein
MRTSILVPLGGLLITVAAPARAEEDYRAIVEVLRACSEIQDGASRMTCYDANVGPRMPTSESVDRAKAATRPTPAPIAPSAQVDPAMAPSRVERAPNGFGSETLAQQRARSAEADVLEATVASARERQPGKFLLTLDDGAEWEFVEAAPDAYDPPRAGSSIRIERGSLGSFRLRYASQRAIRVKRVN